MSLRRLTILFITAFLVATVVTGIATYATSRLTITRLVDRRIATISGVVAGDGDGRADGAPAMLSRIARFTRQRDTGDIGFVLSDARGRMLGGNVRLRRPLPAGFSTLRGGDGIAGLSRGRALARPVGGGLTLVTIAETEPFDDYDAARLRIFVGGFGSIVLIVLGGVAAFGVLVARRIAATRRTAEAIVAGDLTQRIPVRRPADEFDRQALAFNRMLDRIGDLMAGLRHVSDDIAHDLRTPLARLRAQLGAITPEGDQASLQRRVEAAIAQCDDLLDLFAAILRIAEVESGARTAGFAALDLGALAREIGEMMGPVAADSGHSIVVDAPSAVPVVGDRPLLTQALVNLIENAIAHTPAATTIRIEAGRTPAAAFLTVADDGAGIAADQRERALRRFGRVDASRSTPGHGLGLPLVAAIARLHRGTLTLGDARPGLVATMTLADRPPAADPVRR